MIGYMEERCARDWHNEINGWISELSIGIIADGCAWNDSETLELFEEDMSKGIASCRSVHSRTGIISSNEIIIHHLWVAMNMGQTSRNPYSPAKNTKRAQEGGKGITA